MPTDNDRHTRDAPAAQPSPSDTPHGETEAEAVALCAAWEERQRLCADGECLTGCERLDEPLSPFGCKW